MKKALLSIAVLFLLAGVPSTTSAQIAYTIEATIPFDFTVKDMRFSAGEYSLRRVNTYNPHILALRDERGHNLMLFHTINAQLPEYSEDTKLVFQRVGNRYFLSQIFEEGERLGLELIKSDMQKRLEREISYAYSRPVVVNGYIR
ncbi:MAG: hypothetical protein AB1757_07475 [Acidobacteriota bacterium]